MQFHPAVYMRRTFKFATLPHRVYNMSFHLLGRYGRLNACILTRLRYVVCADTTPHQFGKAEFICFTK